MHLEIDDEKTILDRIEDLEDRLDEQEDEWSSAILPLIAGIIILWFVFA